MFFKAFDFQDVLIGWGYVLVEFYARNVFLPVGRVVGFRPYSRSDAASRWADRFCGG
jgi:hypothetical protein